MLERLSRFEFVEELRVLEERNLRCARMRPRMIDVPCYGKVLHPEDCPVISFMRFLFIDIPRLLKEVDDRSMDALQVICLMYESEAGKIFVSWSDEALYGFARLIDNEDRILSYLKGLKNMGYYRLR